MWSQEDHNFSHKSVCRSNKESLTSRSGSLPAKGPIWKEQPHFETRVWMFRHERPLEIYNSSPRRSSVFADCCVNASPFWILENFLLSHRRNSCRSSWLEDCSQHQMHAWQTSRIARRTFENRLRFLKYCFFPGCPILFSFLQSGVSGLRIIPPTSPFYPRNSWISVSLATN